MKKAIKILEVLIVTISLLISVWFTASYIEVITKNGTEKPQYSPYNIFIILTEKEV